jgi:hypothetical protein
VQGITSFRQTGGWREKDDILALLIDTLRDSYESIFQIKLFISLVAFFSVLLRYWGDIIMSMSANSFIRK